MQINKDWEILLSDFLGSVQMRALFDCVKQEYKKGNICPPKEKVFAALNECPVSKVKVVILGQDPYFNQGQAVGLAFSIDHTCKSFPPSLRNIISEVRACFGTCAVEDGDLTPWAHQGVLLLNTCLTVRQGKPLSHGSLGWENFTRFVLECLNRKSNLVFVLWGAHAQKYRDILTNSENLVLTSSHPSPLSASRGFLGCRHFVRINNFLKSRGKTEVIW